MGLGRFGGGVAAAVYLAGRGADLAITDLRPAGELSESMSLLDAAGVQPQWFLDGHPEDAFCGCELLVVNPAVRPDTPIVQRCRADGVPVTSEIELFVLNNPAFTIAVTGSNGKSTTTRLISDLLNANLPPERRVWIGGNIEHSLLSELNRIDAHDVVVLELSSFQLHQLSSSGFRPDVAVVTNVTPNHLDWHSTLEHYIASKHVVTRNQRPTDVMVLPSDLDEWPGLGRCRRFGCVDAGEDGAYVEDGCVIVRSDDDEVAQRVTLSPALRGPHNDCNVAAAVAAIVPVVGDEMEVTEALESFCALPHRMEIVAQGKQRCFINDSSSTTPESTIAAIQSLPRRCVLLVGGADKGVDLTVLGEQIVAGVRGVVAIGATADAMVAAVEAFVGDADGPIVRACDNFESAFRQAVALSEPGDIVLLSPGCSSHGWFTDYRERGRKFTELALQWCEQQEMDQ